jgi:hypothetical protein
MPRPVDTKAPQALDVRLGAARSIAPPAESGLLAGWVAVAADAASSSKPTVDLSLASRRVYNQLRAEWITRPMTTAVVQRGGANGPPHAYSWLALYLEGDLDTDLLRLPRQISADVPTGAGNDDNNSTASSVLQSESASPTGTRIRRGGSQQQRAPQGADRRTGSHRAPPARAVEAARTGVSFSAACALVASSSPRFINRGDEATSLVRTLQDAFTPPGFQALREPDGEPDSGGPVSVLSLAVAVTCSIAAHCGSLEECLVMLSEEIAYLAAVATAKHRIVLPPAPAALARGGSRAASPDVMRLAAAPSGLDWCRTQEYRYQLSSRLLQPIGRAPHLFDSHARNYRRRPKAPAAHSHGRTASSSFAPPGLLGSNSFDEASLTSGEPSVIPAGLNRGASFVSWPGAPSGPSSPTAAAGGGGDGFSMTQIQARGCIAPSRARRFAPSSHRGQAGPLAASQQTAAPGGRAAVAAPGALHDFDLPEDAPAAPPLHSSTAATRRAGILTRHPSGAFIVRMGALVVATAPDEPHNATDRVPPAIRSMLALPANLASTTSALDSLPPPLIASGSVVLMTRNDTEPAALVSDEAPAAPPVIIEPLNLSTLTHQHRPPQAAGGGGDAPGATPRNPGSSPPTTRAGTVRPPPPAAATGQSQNDVASPSSQQPARTSAASPVLGPAVQRCFAATDGRYAAAVALRNIVFGGGARGVQSLDMNQALRHIELDGHGCVAALKFLARDHDMGRIGAPTQHASSPPPPPHLPAPHRPTPAQAVHFAVLHPALLRRLGLPKDDRYSSARQLVEAESPSGRSGLDATTAGRTPPPKRGAAVQRSPSMRSDSMASDATGDLATMTSGDEFNAAGGGGTVSGPKATSGTRRPMATRDHHDHPQRVRRGAQRADLGSDEDSGAHSSVIDADEGDDAGRRSGAGSRYRVPAGNSAGGGSTGAHGDDRASRAQTFSADGRTTAAHPTRSTGTRRRRRQDLDAEERQTACCTSGGCVVA